MLTSCGGSLTLRDKTKILKNLTPVYCFRLFSKKPQLRHDVISPPLFKLLFLMTMNAVKKSLN